MTASSSIGIIRDSIISKIETLLPTKTRIIKPRALQQNNDRLLIDGLGVYVGSSSPSDQSLGLHMTVESSNIEIVLSKIIYSLENSYVNEAYVEDTLQLEKELIIEGLGDLTLASIENSLLSIVYAGDDGGQYIFAEKNNFLALTITFNVVYSKNKTYII